MLRPRECCEPQQVRREGVCAGGVERQIWLHLLPASRADKSCPSSSPPTGPAPPLSRWTTAIFQHQAPDTVPCPSWLNCSQTENSGTVPAVSSSQGDYPSGLGAERRPSKIPRVPFPPRLPPLGWHQAPPRCPGRSESNCKETSCGPGVPGGVSGGARRVRRY